MRNIKHLHRRRRTYHEISSFAAVVGFSSAIQYHHHRQSKIAKSLIALKECVTKSAAAIRVIAQRNAYAPGALCHERQCRKAFVNAAARRLRPDEWPEAVARPAMRKSSARAGMSRRGDNFESREMMKMRIATPRRESECKRRPPCTSLKHRRKRLIAAALLFTRESFGFHVMPAAAKRRRHTLYARFAGAAKEMINAPARSALMHGALAKLNLLPRAILWQSTAWRKRRAMTRRQIKRAYARVLCGERQQRRKRLRKPLGGYFLTSLPSAAWRVYCCAAALDFAKCAKLLIFYLRSLPWYGGAGISFKYQ